MTFSRRDLLRTLLIGPAGLGLSMAPRRGRAAADVALPRRVVFLYTPEGLHYAAADRSTAWVEVRSQTDFTPVGMAAPLARHRANMVFFDNLAVISEVPTVDGQNGQRGGVETHIGSKAMLLTNTDVTDFGNFLCQTPRGESLDIFLGRQLGQALTPAWPSVQLGLVTDGGQANTMSFLADGTPVLSNRDPMAVYQGFFGAQASASRLARRKSVLDLVAGDMARFLASLPPEDRLRAEAQGDAIRTLEARLSATQASCKSPQATASAGLNLDDGHNGARLSAAMMDMVAAAFACDQTRIISLVFQGVYSSVAGGLLGNANDNIHGLSHNTDPAPMIAAKSAMFEQVAQLADRLAAIPEGEGTMLDNTLIVHATEETDNHSLNNLPFFTLGGKNLGVNIGNHLALPTTQKSTNGASQGFPVGGLWRSVIRAMGLPAQSFGNPTWSAAEVPGLVA